MEILQYRMALALRWSGLFEFVTLIHRTQGGSKSRVCVRVCVLGTIACLFCRMYSTLGPRVSAAVCVSPLAFYCV